MTRQEEDVIQEESEFYLDNTEQQFEHSDQACSRKRANSDDLGSSFKQLGVTFTSSDRQRVFKDPSDENEDV